MTEVRVVVQKLVDRAKNPARPTRRLSSANVKSLNSLTSASVVGASRLHAFSNEQCSMSLNDGILPRRFQISHHGQDPPGLAQVLKIGTELCTLVYDQNFHSVTMFEPELSCPACVLPGGNVSHDRCRATSGLGFLDPTDSELPSCRCHAEFSASVVLRSLDI